MAPFVSALNWAYAITTLKPFLCDYSFCHDINYKYFPGPLNVLSHENLRFFISVLYFCSKILLIQYVDEKLLHAVVFSSILREQLIKLMILIAPKLVS